MNKKGAILILVCIVSVILIVLGAGLLSRGISENNISKKYVEDTQSFWLAESGVQYALRAINDSSWVNWTLGEDGNYTTNQSLGSGFYQVTVSDVSTSNPKVTSSGSMGSLSHGVDVILKLATNPIFTHAAYGKTSLFLSGNGFTDSYDSSIGIYGGANISSNGDVGTNGTTTGAVDLNGGAIVNGDASTGEGGTVTLSGGSTVTGSTTGVSEKDLDSVVVPGNLTSLFSSGSYSLGNGDVGTLSAGDYKYTEFNIQNNAEATITGDVSIYITGSSSITVHGEVIISSGASLTIYMDGTAKFNGHGFVNVDEKPENVILYSTYSGSGDAVKVTGNGDFYGVVYAPDGHVKVSGNGDVYGALVGDTVQISGNGDVHYDEALALLDSGIPQYEVQAWIEQNNPYPLN